METTSYQEVPSRRGVDPTVNDMDDVTRGDPSMLRSNHKSHMIEDDHSQQITLGLEIRRARLIGCTAATVILIGGMTIWFNHGFSVLHFDSRDKNTTEQTKLLDKYNSYSGNIAAIFSTPIELFVTVSVQLIVLRFMADTFTRPELSWRISAITLLLGAGVGYMISNSFNALNVQLRPQGIQSVISNVDLGDDNYIESNESFFDIYPQGGPELTPQNPVNNTILRTLLVPDTPIGGTFCLYSSFRDGVNTLSGGTVDETGRPFLTIGMPQREWQSRILQRALPSTTFRLIVNPTNKSINDGIQSSALPMNASTAALLFADAMINGISFFPWGARRAYVNQSDILRRYPFNDTKVHNVSGYLPVMEGLLPADDKLANNETAQREFFIPAALAAASRQFANATRTKISDIVMEFSHTRVSPSITFDALTLEVEIDPKLLATTISRDNSTRYTVVNQQFECPIDEHCFIRKPKYSAVNPMYDSPAQVVAFRVCTKANGEERHISNVTIQNNTILKLVSLCSSTDEMHAQAITIISIGKRMVADAIEQNVSVAANGTTVDVTSATITNLRKIYSFTVGRLSWDFTDLSDKFNAKCDTKDTTCRGLEFPLGAPLGSSTHVDSGVKQYLVVGENAVRHAQRALKPSASRVNFDKTTLVAVAEPPEVYNASNFYRAMSGDLLLPHNIRNITWDEGYLDATCDSEAEKRVVALRLQHLYMEHSLQAAYTAGTYYLFQSAVVRDKISLTTTTSSLAFQRNSQAVDVWVSTPSQNMWLTLSGCLILIAGLMGVIIKSQWFTQSQEDALAHITEPHAIARVMMDERRYPPLFLRRQVVEKDQVANVDEFAIASISLQQQEQEHEARNRRHQGMETSAQVPLRLEHQSISHV